jgi:hypothetical protein
MIGPNLTVASNLAADSTAVQWEGGRAVVTAEATFGGGTVALQFKSLNGAWVGVDNGSFTAAGSKLVYVPRGEVRVAITTATAVYAYLHHV